MDTPRRMPAYTLAIIAAICIVAVGSWLAWQSDDSPAEPDLPAVKPQRFVGSETCAQCHVEQYEKYLTSGHSRTFWTTKDFPFREKFAELTFHDPERHHTLDYVATESGLEVGMPGMFGGGRLPLQFAFGSGEHAVTLMSLVSGDPDYPLGIEHRVSWFSGQDQAGLTPGHLRQPIRQDVEHLGKIMEGEVLRKCFECHTTSCEIQGDRLVNLLPNVGCESCHIGGAQHADAMAGESSTEHGLGFEARPWRTKDQIQICARCHRGEDDLKQGDIRPDNWKIVRYQPVGLVQSKCFTESEKMTCATCHDPHQHAARRTPQEYEQKCLNCHDSAQDSVPCPVSPAADCVSCHMPRVEIHPSISFHDHWIRVRGEKDPPAVTEKSR